MLYSYINWLWLAKVVFIILYLKKAKSLKTCMLSFPHGVHCFWFDNYMLKHIIRSRNLPIILTQMSIFCGITFNHLLPETFPHIIYSPFGNNIRNCFSKKKKHSDIWFMDTFSLVFRCYTAVRQEIDIQIGRGTLVWNYQTPPLKRPFIANQVTCFLLKI